MIQTKPPIPHEEMRLAMNALTSFEVLVTDTALVLDAQELARNEQLSWFEALIVEAAVRCGCEQLFSENLSHGRKFDKLVVRHPFLPK